MFTADDVDDERRNHGQSELDKRIKQAVREAIGNRASIRVYIEDDFCRSIGYELERRGFKNVYVPAIMLKGDVSFEW